MKSFRFLAILSYFVFCEATNTTVTEFCEEQCKEECIPCQEPVRCTDEQTDCGLGPPDPKFGGVCPPHSICVPKDMNCKNSSMFFHTFSKCSLLILKRENLLMNILPILRTHRSML